MRFCPECGGTLRIYDSRPQLVDHGPSFTIRRKRCEKCGKRFTTNEVWVEELRKYDPGYVPLDRRDEYRHLMKKLKVGRLEVLRIMGLLNAAQKRQVTKDHQL